MALSGDALVVGEASDATSLDGSQDDDSAAASGAIYIFH